MESLTPLCECQKLGCIVKMMETGKGHYGIPLFNNIQAAECHYNHVKSENSYDISELERDVEQSPAAEGQAIGQQEHVAPPPEKIHGLFR